MPSSGDFFKAIKDIRAGIDDTNSRLDALQAMLSGDLNQLLALTAYTNQALYENALQNDTIICILEKISKNTCDLVNQAHLQTALQTAIRNSTTGLAEMYATTHAEAALARERERSLREEMEECCPPKPPAPACKDEPCARPKPLDPPPAGQIIE